MESAEEVDLARRLSTIGTRAAPPTVEEIDKVLGLLDKGRGRRLARFAWSVLRRTERPADYFKPLIDAAGFLVYNVVPVGETGSIGGPPAESILHLVLPEDLQAVGDEAWRVMLDDCFRFYDVGWLKVEPPEGRLAELRSRYRRMLDDKLRGFAPPERIAVPVAATWAARDETAPTTRALAVERLGQWGRSGWACDQVRPLLKRIPTENPQVRVAWAGALLDVINAKGPYGSTYTGTPLPPEGKPFLETVLGLLDDADPRVADTASYGLKYRSKITTAIIPRLLKMAAECRDVPDRHLRLARILAGTDNPEVADELAVALIDHDERLMQARYAQDIRHYLGKMLNRRPADHPAVAAVIGPRVAQLFADMVDEDLRENRSKILGLAGCLPYCGTVAREQLDRLLVVGKQMKDDDLLLRVARHVAPEDPRCREHVRRVLMGDDVSDAATACHALVGMNWKTPEIYQRLKFLASRSDSGYLRREAQKALLHMQKLPMDRPSMKE